MTITIRWDEKRIISIGKDIDVHLNFIPNKIRKKADKAIEELFASSTEVFAYTTESSCIINTVQLKHQSIIQICYLIRSIRGKYDLNIEFANIKEHEENTIDDIIRETNEWITQIKFRKDKS